MYKLLKSDDETFLLLDQYVKESVFTHIHAIDVNKERTTPIAKHSALNISTATVSLCSF